MVNTSSRKCPRGSIRILCIVITIGSLFFHHSGFSQHPLLEKVNKHLEQGDTSRALKVLNRNIQKHSLVAELYLKRAQVKIDRRDYTPAMVDLNSYCSLNKSCGQASLLKGLVLYRQGNFNGAIEHFSDYSRNSGSFDGWFYLGLCHMALQNFMVAVHSFEKAIETEPGNIQAWYNAGLCAFRNEDYTQADSLFRQALTLNPSDKDVLLAYALTLNKRAAFEESNKVLNELLAVDASSHVALYNIGVNYYNLDQRDLACDYWTKAKNSGNNAASVAIEDYCPPGKN